MKNCPKCSNPHDKPGTFCSRKCANSRIFSKETRLKKSLSNKKYWSGLTEEEKNEVKEQLETARYLNRGMCFERLMGEDWDSLAYQSMRRRIIIEQKGKCNKCGVDKWLGERIILEIDHKDGNNGNNTRENMEGLCPNCHSLTPTWRGKKNKISTRSKKIIKDFKLLEEMDKRDGGSSPSEGTN